MSSDNRVLLGLFLVGLLVGWFSSEHFGSGQQSYRNSPLVKEKHQAQLGDDIAELGAVAELKPEKAQEVEANNVDQQTSALLKLVFQDTDNYQLTAERIIAYLVFISTDHGNGISKGVLKERKLRQLTRDIPELNYALIDQLPNIENEHARTKLDTLLLLNNMTQRPFLEPYLIERIKLNESRTQMLELLGRWGLQSKSNIAYLFTELPYFEDPDQISNAIRAISYSSWVQEAALPPNDQKRIGESFDDYFNSPHPELRAASVASMKGFPSPNSSEKLVTALKDPAKVVRDEAFLIYINNPFPSDEIERTLISNAENSQLSIPERLQIVNMLRESPLSQETLAKLDTINSELDQYMKSLSEDEVKNLFAR